MQDRLSAYGHFGDRSVLRHLVGGKVPLKMTTEDQFMVGRLRELRRADGAIDK